MKTNIFMGLTVTALTLASCSKDEISSVNNLDGKAIGFEISTGKTRAGVSNLDVLQHDAEGFGVFATNGASKNVFIDNEVYRYDGAWRWAADKVMWPAEEDGYPVNFYAYYPLKNITLNEHLTTHYTVADTPEEQVDLLATNQTDVMVKPVSGDVSLAFKHILSKIDFKVVTGAFATVEVQSIAIKNVGNTGVFNFARLDWSTQPVEWSSQYNYMEAPVKTANIFAGETTPKDVTGSSGSLMLMPQDLSLRGWDKAIETIGTLSYIEVVYRAYDSQTGEDIVGFTNVDDYPDYEGEVSGPLFVKVGYPLPTLWLMGKAFTYTIFIADGNSSGGNLVEENFIDENGDDTDIPVINPETGEPVEPPAPVFPGNTIGFMVSVEGWDETGNIHHLQ